MPTLSRFFLLTLFSTLLLAACTSTPQPASTSTRLQVVATTTILGDVVRQVAGDTVDLTVLLPHGVDPHSFSPSPQDLASVSKADLVFIAGAGLEGPLLDLLESALSGSSAQLFTVNQGINLRSAEDHDTGEMTQDPHVWFDPHNVILWTDAIEAALAAADPANQAAYQANAAAYHQQLQELDAWILTQVEQVPAGKRRIVSDHEIFGYFAERYGFELSGAVIPAASAAASPSAQSLAALQDAILALQVPAIFVGSTVDSRVADRIAEDTGVKIVPVYTDSLTPPGGPASTYLDLMRYTVTAIVENLK